MDGSSFVSRCHKSSLFDLLLVLIAKTFDAWRKVGRDRRRRKKRKEKKRKEKKEEEEKKLSTQQDSNPQHPVYETSALLLCYNCSPSIKLHITSLAILTLRARNCKRITVGLLQVQVPLESDVFRDRVVGQIVQTLEIKKQMLNFWGRSSWVI